MLGTFIDTLIVCTMTALVILTSGAWTMTGADGAGLTGAVLTSTSYQNSIAGGQYIVTVSLAVFAFTTILGWSYYGERCWQYLFKEKSLLIYRGPVGPCRTRIRKCEGRFCLEPVRHVERPDGGAEPDRAAAPGTHGVQGHARVFR